jgi:beta-galactosidase
MKRNNSKSLPLFLATACFTAPTVVVLAQDNVILPQGTFEQPAANGKPSGWTMQSPDNTTLAGDAKNHWVQLRDGAVMTHFLKLAPEWTKVTLSGRLKLSNYEKGPQGWHGARVGLRFLDDKNQMVGQYPPALDLPGNTDWMTKEVTLDIPAGATQLQIEPALWGSKGLLEVDDLVVKASTVAAPTVAAVDAAWPASARVAWGSEQVAVQNTKRASMSLNGPWRFSPAQAVRGQANTAPEKGWGYIQVPGDWRRDDHMIEAGKGPQWVGLDRSKLAGAWYERRFKIPADWNGSHISIDFERVSTDATFWVNDKPAGAVNWPEGELDITNLVKAGEEVTLRAFVVATIEPGEVVVMMGTAPGQNWTTTKQLESGGLIGNVTLQRRPMGAFVSDVFVQPSTRQKQLKVDFELTGVTQDGPVELVASLRDENGKEEKRFTQTVNVKAAPTQRVQASWDWANPRLWDVDQPNLYTLHLATRGAGVEDEPITKFGFREVWVEGRQVFLNNTPFRIRPMLMNSGGAGLANNGLKEAREMGFNFGELWPGGTEERSNPYEQTKWYDVADRAGFPISGMMPHMGWMGGNMNSPERVAAFAAGAQRIARRYRNHPSVVFWGTSGNMIGGSLDPAHAGIREAARNWEFQKETMTSRAIPFGEKGVALIKAADPTRPVFIHHGGPVGDIYTLNEYLNFIPLQEREEWLTTYAQKGDMPLMYVEFGTPVSLSLTRSRNGFQNSMRTENLLSEFTAIYLGNEAFQLETPAYRKRSAELFEKDQTYAWHHGMVERDYAPSWLKLQDLFISNTWRSWRTMGITGGMIPWDNGYAKLNGKLTPAGEALRANNSETLAYIAGAAQTGDIAAFTAKDHSYFAGEKISKQISLINDSRKAQPYTLRWTATVDNKAIGTGEKSGNLAVGQTLLVPFEFTATDTTSKVGGSISLDATIGANKHSDQFAFRIWPRAVASKGNFVAFDPEGKTSAMLRALGYTVSPWNGGASPAVLVIGRNALKSGAKLPGDLKAFVSNGGRVLMSGHDPHWLRENMSMRVSHHQSRRVFPIANNPLASELDGSDLRDWRGHSTLLDPRPDYANGKGPDVQIAKTSTPYAGWRVGNRGTVASAAIEKPHRSGWTPLLEAEFDLAYSPLMDLDYGKGKVIWSQLDLEDHASLDPAAQRLARLVVNYAMTAPLAPRVAASYIGGASGSALLKSLGLQFKTVTALPASGVVIIGADATIADAQLETFARNGGKVLFLARQGVVGAAGLQLQEKADFIGSLHAPAWSEARGLSASDLRWRNAAKAWVAAPANGWEVGADGLLARRAVGTGVMLWSQIDPSALPADEKTYFRFTRWRQTRALSQVLANLGAAFEMDARIFSPRAAEKEPVVPLVGEWRARLIKRLDASPSPDKGHADPGMSEEAKRSVAADFDDAGWQVVKAPGGMEQYGGNWDKADGEAVLRKTIEVPAALQGQDLKLSLGSIDDHDETYFNGVRVGGKGAETPDAYGVQREYTIPANLVKPGKNVIAVRVWDKFGGGGFTAGDVKLFQIKSAKAWVEQAAMYHPDYREDFDLGDDPYRFYNW